MSPLLSEVPPTENAAEKQPACTSQCYNSFLPHNVVTQQRECTTGDESADYVELAVNSGAIIREKRDQVSVWGRGGERHSL